MPHFAEILRKLRIVLHGQKCSTTLTVGRCLILQYITTVV